MCSPETRISLIATARPWFAWVFLVYFGHFAVFLTAAPVYWDLNGNFAGSGSASPSGLWDLSSANWNPTPAGDTTDPVFWNNTGADTAVFSAGSDATGSYLVTVDGTLALSGVTVEEGGTITLAPQTTGGSLDFAAVLAQFNIASGATLVANVNLAGSAGLTKTGTGTLQLNGLVNPSGPYTVGAGTLAIGDGLTISGTTLNLGGVAGASSTVSLGVGSVYNLGGAINFLNANTPLAGLIQGGTITLNGNRTISVQNTTAVGTDLEISSVIANGSISPSGITKTTGGTLLLSGNNTYTGTTTVSTGMLLVQGSAGSISASATVSVAAGATLTAGSTTDNAAVNRIGDDTVITLNGVQTNSGASFNYNGADFAAAAIHTEKVGSVVFAGDARSYLNLTAGAGDQLVFRLTSLRKEGNAVGLVRAANLGKDASTPGAIRILVDEALPLLGGATDTTKAGILPWLLSDPSDTGLGSSLVTYDSTRGLRPLDVAEYLQLPAPDLTSANVGVNVLKSTAGAAAVTSSVRVNSWTTTQGGTVTLSAGVVLGIDSGAMLFSTGGSFSGGTLDLSSYSRGYFYLHANAQITQVMDAVLQGDNGFTMNAAGSNTKVVALNKSNAFTGGITVLQGIVELRGAGALNASGVNSLNLLSGTFRLNGQSAIVAGLDGAGAIVNNHASNESTLTINGGGTFVGTINDGAIGKLNLEKKGTAALILGDLNAYTGTTKVLGGVLHVNQNGNADTNGRLSATSAIEVRQGGTLRINNGNSTNNNTNRINDAASITLGGGTLTFNTNTTAGVVYSETVGALFLEAGANQVTTQPSNANATSTFTFTSLGGRTAGATLNFGGGSLGTTLNKVVF
ncbi:MAG: beta strand repeat-containing protein, partial [Verrucomicrobium sp.]